MGSKLGATMARLARRGVVVGTPARGAGSDDASAYEQVTRRGLEDLSRQVDRLELKLNGLLLAVGSSILVDLYRTLIVQ